MDSTVESESDLRYTTAPDRRTRLIQLVVEEGYCTTADLSLEFGVSEMTIRRDVARLVEEGQLRGVRGGVTALPQSALRGSEYTERERRMTGVKRALAETAVAQLRSGTVIAIDAGTTGVEITRALPSDRRINVITHSLPVVDALLGSHNIEVLCLGGVLHTESRSFSGPGTLDAISNLRVATFYLAASALNDRGVFCGNDFDALVKRALIDVADEVVLVTDSTKFTSSSMARVCALGAIDKVIVDSGITAADLATLTAASIDVTLVDAALPEDQ